MASRSSQSYLLISAQTVQVRTSTVCLVCVRLCLFPQILKQFDGGRRMSAVVIVSEGK